MALRQEYIQKMGKGGWKGTSQTCDFQQMTENKRKGETRIRPR